MAGHVTHDKVQKFLLLREHYAEIAADSCAGL
jgi:hypothetical protein